MSKNWDKVTFSEAAMDGSKASKVGMELFFVNFAVKVHLFLKKSAKSELKRFLRIQAKGHF